MKQAKTAVKNSTKTAKQEVKQTKQQVKQATEVTKQDKEVKKVVYLLENVSGKQLMNNKIDTNNSNKKEISTISYCIRQALKHDKNFFTSFKQFNERDIIPSNLLKFLKPTEAKNGKFSVWLVMTLTKRFYSQK
jgi:hypothetical protein